MNRRNCKLIYRQRNGSHASRPIAVSFIFGMLVQALLAVMLLTGCGRSSSADLYEEAIDAAANAQWNKARNLTRKILAVDSNHLDSHILHGISLYYLQQPEKSISTLAQAAQNAPENFAAQYFYGWVLFESGAYGDALMPLRKAYGIRKDQPDLLILLAKCSIEQNLTEGLRYLQALRRFPAYREDPRLYNDMAMLWISQPSYERARELLLEAHDKAPENPVILQNLAVLHDHYLQDYRQAAQYYQLCLRYSRQRQDHQREAKVRRRLRTVVDKMRSSSRQ